MNKPCLVLDENFVQIGVIPKYKSQEYVQKFCGIGTFSIRLPMNERNIHYMQNGVWFLLDGIALGYKDSESTTSSSDEITISGKLCEVILSWLVFNKTQVYTGERAKICEDIVTKNFLQDDERKKAILNVVESGITFSESIKTQRTGSTISDGIAEILSVRELGFSCTPVLRVEAGETEQAITSIDFECKKGVDHSIENTEGNKPIVFSKRFKNLSGFNYTKDSSNQKNYYYVAGEGEGQDRKVISFGEEITNSLYRKEAYVDARDLQSTDPDTQEAYPDEEYEEMLRQRGEEKKSEYKLTESFDCDIIQKKGFQYNVDFFLGDYLTVIDEMTGLRVKVQVTEMSKIESETESVALTFGNKKMTFIQKLKKKGVL